MIINALKLRSFAVVLSLAAPFAIAEESSTGLTPNAAAELLFQIENLQLEVSKLRGLVEEQSHELSKMKRNQLDRYIDLDKRVSTLMTRPEPASTVVLNESIDPTDSNTSDVPVINVADAAKAENTYITVPKSKTSVVNVAPVITEAPTPKIREEYRVAYELIRQKQFKEADVAFTEFVKKYPRNELTGNAYYWLGELKLVLGDQENALVYFDKVSLNFAGHSKEADAIYKMGIVQDQLNNKDKAKGYLQQVISRFPTTNTAKLASSYLSNMK